MESSSAGSVVLVPFPFSDLSRSKLRPAVVLAEISREDYVLCQSDEQPLRGSRGGGAYRRKLHVGELEAHELARPGKLFTANADLFESAAGELKEEVRSEIVEAVTDLLRAGKQT